MASRAEQIIAEAGSVMGFSSGSFTYRRGHSDDPAEINQNRLAVCGEPISVNSLPWKYHASRSETNILSCDSFTMDGLFTAHVSGAHGSEADSLGGSMTWESTPLGISYTDGPSSSATASIDFYFIPPGSFDPELTDDTWMFRKGRWKLEWGIYLSTTALVFNGGGYSPATLWSGKLLTVSHSTVGADQTLRKLGSRDGGFTAGPNDGAGTGLAGGWFEFVDYYDFFVHSLWRTRLAIGHVSNPSGHAGVYYPCAEGDTVFEMYLIATRQGS